VSAADTNGVYSLVEIVSSPGDGTPLHVHDNEDEHIIVLEGTARIAYGDEVFDAEAGKAVTLLRKIPHAWGNRRILSCASLWLLSPAASKKYYA